MAAGSLTVRTWRYCVECSGGVTGNRWSSRSSFNQSAHVIDVQLQFAPWGQQGDGLWTSETLCWGLELARRLEHRK